MEFQKNCSKQKTHQTNQEYRYIAPDEESRKNQLRDVLKLNFRDCHLVPILRNQITEAEFLILPFYVKLEPLRALGDSCSLRLN